MTEAPAPADPVVVRRLGLADYETVWRAMQRFVAQRCEDTPDELWLLQHPPVYTRGLNCSMDTLRPSRVPVVQSDRGGQITYHGPGQIIAYPLIDMRRRKLGVKQLVSLLEQSVIGLLAEYDLTGERRAGAPGVYMDGRKIAALGVRIRRGSSYHGLSLNVDMDLSPFDNIDPCGYQGLEMTQLSSLGIREDINTIESKLAGHLLALLSGARSDSQPR